MIVVDVQPYCNNCLDFEPDVEKPEKVYDGTGDPIYITDTVITCTKRKRCENIRKYIERELKGEKK